MLTTLLDIMKMNAADPMIGLIEDIVLATPEINFGAARTIDGIFYEALARTSFPASDGGFRSPNQGKAITKSNYELRRFECFMVQQPMQVDKQVADSYRDGADAQIAIESQGVLQGELLGLCKQFYYGRQANGNGLGCPGLLDMYDSAGMVVDAGGTTDNTATSVWAVKFGPQMCEWIYGNGATLGFTPLRVQSVLDANSNPYVAYCKELIARVGIQLGSQIYASRIKKITADASHTMSDALCNQMLAKWPPGVQPDMIFCSRRSLNQWQASRTATNPTGNPAPFPTSMAGISGQNIPIYLTSGILETETLAL